MAKYTKNDPDVTYLDPHDQSNYHFELLKHDVEKNPEPHIGAQSVGMLTDAGKIGDLFKSPVKFTVGLFALVMFLLTVVLIIYIIVFIILKIKGGSENIIRLEVMKKMFIYFVVAILVLVLLYWFLNKIVLEATALGFIAK
jgi:hypothetical protein